MCRLQGSLQALALRLVDPVDQVKLVVTLPDILAREGIEARGFFGVGFAEYVFVETVYGLTLVLGGFEVVRIKSKSVVGATGVLLVGPVQESAGPSPAAVYEGLVEFGGQR